VAALVPKAEIEGEMGDSHVGLQARLMSQALRKLTGTVARSKCVLMFTNQIRMKIGVMFGSPETTTGGNALKFYASQRLDIRRIGAIKETSKDKKGEMVVVGNRTRVKVVKNKMAPPFREAEFDIYYGKGVSRSGEVVDMASDLNFIQKSGAWYSVGPERIGQGRDNARTYLEEHPETMAKLEAMILAHHGVAAADSTVKDGIKPEGAKESAGKADAGKAEGGRGDNGHGAASNTHGSTTAASRATSVVSDDDDSDDEDAGSKARGAKPNGNAKTAAAAAAPAKRAVRAN